MAATWPSTAPRSSAPHSDRGEDVVRDRFTGSTLVYQGHARGLDLRGADITVFLGHPGGLQPDVVFLLAAAPEVARTRMSAEPDRIEAAGASFHERVAADATRPWPLLYRVRWRVIDGSGTVSEVETCVLEALAGERSA